MRAEETTVRWFGPDWRAEANAAECEIPVPVGEHCQCGDPIEPGQQGVRIPHLGDIDRQFTHYHLDCFLVTIMPADLVHEALSGNPLIIKRLKDD